MAAASYLCSHKELSFVFQYWTKLSIIGGSDYRRQWNADLLRSKANRLQVLLVHVNVFRVSSVRKLNFPSLVQSNIKKKQCTHLGFELFLIHVSVLTHQHCVCGWLSSSLGSPLAQTHPEVHKKGSSNDITVVDDACLCITIWKEIF